MKQYKKQGEVLGNIPFENKLFVFWDKYEILWEKSNTIVHVSSKTNKWFFWTVVTICQI